MEWLLLYMVLSAISLEGIALFVNEESFHCAFIDEIKDYDGIDWFFHLLFSISLYVLMLVLSHFMAYVLLSLED